MTDWDDRLVDSALRELHGSRPPDLSARLVLALRERPVGPLPHLTPASPPARRPLWHAFVVAAAVLMGALVGAYVLRDVDRGDPRQVLVDLHVHTGALECIEVRPGQVRRTQARAGARVPFDASPGNGLRAVEPCRFRVGPFGELATGPATELEVKSMSVSWKHGVVAASAMSVAVVAGVVTWHTLHSEGTALAGETVHLQAEQGGVPPTAVAELEQLRERLQQLEQQNSELQLRLARQPAEPALPVAKPAEPEIPPELVDQGPTFLDAQYADVLAKLDWRQMGEVTNEMAPLLVELAKVVEEGGDMPMDLIAKIQELNSKLFGQVPALMKSGLPGTGANGAYTHPLVSANILAKTLDAAGRSLDKGQRDRIAGLVHLFSVEVQGVVDSTQEFDVQKLAAEAETKDRFYREIASLLTPEQQRVMFPENATRYEGTSLFHSSLFTRQYTDVVAASSPVEFARSVANTCGEQLGLGDQATSQVRAIVERMSAASSELWAEPGGAVESELHILRAGRTQAAIRQQVEIMREILRTVPLTPAQRQQLTSMRRLFVPLPK